VSSAVRCFVAVQPPQSTIGSLAAALARLRSAACEAEVGLRTVAARNLNLTVQVLADIEPEALEAVQLAVERVAARHDPFEVVLEGMSVSPSPEEPAFIWAEPVGAEATLLALGEDLRETLGQLGFESDGPSPRPHVALARVLRGDPSAVTGLLVTEPLGPLPVHRLSVMTDEADGAPTGRFRARWRIPLRRDARLEPADEEARRERVSQELERRLARRALRTGPQRTNAPKANSADDPIDPGEEP